MKASILIGAAMLLAVFSLGFAFYQVKESNELLNALELKTSKLAEKELEAGTLRNDLAASKTVNSALMSMMDQLRLDCQKGKNDSFSGRAT